MIKSESTEQLAYDNIFDAITDDKEIAKALKAESDKKIAARELGHFEIDRESLPS